MIYFRASINISERYFVISKIFLYNFKKNVVVEGKSQFILHNKEKGEVVKSKNFQ